MDERSEASDQVLEEKLRSLYTEEVQRVRADVPPARNRGRVRPAASLPPFVIPVLAAALALVLARQVVSPPAGTPSPATSPLAAGVTGSIAPSAGVEGRYWDGIPRTIDGEAVLRFPDALLTARARPDETPFLVGGWYEWGLRRSCGALGLDPLGDPCLPFGFGNVPGNHEATDWLALAQGVAPRSSGPVVFRVHAKDSRAIGCDQEARLWCQHRLVAEALVWSGDATPRGSPITVTEAVVAARAAASVSLGAAGEGTRGRSLVVLPAGLLLQCSPSRLAGQAFLLRGDPRLRALVVFPSEAARLAADAELVALSSLVGSTPAGCPAVVDPSGPAGRWLHSKNVAVLLQDSGTELEELLTALLAGSYPAQLPSIERATWSSEAGSDLGTTFELARASGQLRLAQAMLRPGSCCKGSFREDALARITAGALPFHVAPVEGQVTEASVGATIWADLESDHLLGTAKLYDVDHAGVTNARETLLAAEERSGGWSLWLVEAAPFPPDPYGTPDERPAASPAGDTKCSELASPPPGGCG